MNREEIIRMAQEIAAQYSKAERFQTWTHDYMMQRLMELIEAEREACAKIADQYVGQDLEHNFSALVAHNIRARGDV